MSHIEGSAPPPLSAHGFVRFYTPLAATSLLLTATTPILTAALARSADPVTALAGYGVAFAVCGVLYAPLLVIQQVAAARLLAGGSFAPVKRFACLTGGLLSVLGLVIAHTLIGDVVFGTMVGVEGAVQDEASLAMAFLWPIPFLTAVRAAHQGRLVAGHRTLPIAWATGGRTGVLGVVAFGLLATGGGAWLGAMAFTAGLAFETCVVWASPTPGLPPEREGGEADQKSIALFSAPLMLNVFLWWATPLVINATLARTSDPAPALAAFAVVEAVAWFIAAPVGQLQHASIALVRCSDTHRRVQAWGATVALVMTSILLLLSAPQIREPLLGSVFVLDDGLLSLAGAALPIAAAYPVLYGLRQYYQGLFVRSGRSLEVGIGAVLRVVFIVVAASVAGGLALTGAVLGVSLAVSGLVIEGVFLRMRSRRGVLPELRARRASAVHPDVFGGAT